MSKPYHNAGCVRSRTGRVGVNLRTVRHKASDGHVIVRRRFIAQIRCGGRHSVKAFSIDLLGHAEAWRQACAYRMRLELAVRQLADASAAQRKEARRIYLRRWAAQRPASVLEHRRKYNLALYHQRKGGPRDA